MAALSSKYFCLSPMHTLETIVWQVDRFKGHFCVSGYDIFLMRDSFWDVISRKFGLEEGGWCMRKRRFLGRVLERDMEGMGDCSSYCSAFCRDWWKSELLEG